MVIARKKDKFWRTCHDYRDLNKITLKEKFTISNIDEILYEIHEVAYFIKLDIKLGYN